jgi:hypothetical protein
METGELEMRELNFEDYNSGCRISHPGNVDGSVYESAEREYVEGRIYGSKFILTHQDERSTVEYAPCITYTAEEYYAL